MPRSAPGADVYEANDLPPLLAAVVAAKLRGKPVVYRAHELWSEATPNVRFAAFWRFMERYARAEMPTTS